MALLAMDDLKRGSILSFVNRRAPEGGQNAGERTSQASVAGCVLHELKGKKWETGEDGIAGEASRTC